MTDATRQLEAAGFELQRMPDKQREVLADLSDDEVRVLTSIKQRLDTAGSDVEGHVARAADTGYVFW